LVKVIVTGILFIYLNRTQDNWYFLISWFVNWVVVVSISWWIARMITRDVICKIILPRINPTGKAVLITGCDSGFGYMTSIELNRLGFFIFATFLDSEGDGAKKLLEDAPYPSRILNIQMNVTSPTEIAAAYDNVRSFLDSSSETNELFAVINNAGISLPSPIEWAKENSLDPYDSHIEVNTFGVIRVTRKFLPLIRKSKGRIMNLSSIFARSNINGMNPYTVSKAATAKFTEGLQEELAPFGVTVCDINPWFFKTQILNPKGLIPARIKRFEESTDEIKNFYGREYLKKNVKDAVSLVSDKYFVNQHPERVIDAIVDAVTSAEPDAVYRIISPAFRPMFWVINDYLPWELIMYVRRFLMKLQDFKKVNIDEYVDMLKLNERNAS